MGIRTYVLGVPRHTRRLGHDMVKRLAIWGPAEPMKIPEAASEIEPVFHTISPVHSCSVIYEFHLWQP